MSKPPKSYKTGTNNDFTGALYTYPWDLSDEGVDQALDRIVDLTGCTEIQLTPGYHVSNYFLPHNPKSPIRFGENGAIFYTPQLSRYEATDLKPRVSPSVTTPDYFESHRGGHRSQGSRVLRVERLLLQPPPLGEAP